MSPEDRIKTTDFTNPLNLISEGFFDRTGGLLVPLPVQLAPTGPTRSPGDYKIRFTTLEYGAYLESSLGRRFR